MEKTKSKESINQLRKVTLCFLLKDNQILLAMKKRGFGMGRWNGVGGKPQEGESILDTAKREAFEEIGVNIKSLEHVATLNFLFPDTPEDKNWNQQVIVYFVRDWEGEPVESEEMKPKWFSFDNIPYEEMWEDDLYWIPLVLKNQTVTGSFTFNNDQKLQNHEIYEGLEPLEE